MSYPYIYSLDIELIFILGYYAPGQKQTSDFSRYSIIEAFVTNFLSGGYLRIMEVKNVVHRGAVKWFDDIKGYGYIQSDTGEEVFVHFTEIIQEKGFRTLSPGNLVEFEMFSGEKGLKAINVTKLNNKR